jgi:phosphoglycolate phosphatase
MTRYRLAIFDFDGTLVDSLPWFRTSLQETIARFDLAPVSPEELEAMRGLSARDIMARLKVSTWQLPASVSDMRKRKLAAAGETPLFAGIPAMLADLQRLGIELAIVSSDSEASVRLVLGPTASLITRFDCGAAVFGKHWKFGAWHESSGRRRQRPSASATKSATSRPLTPPAWIPARWHGATRLPPHCSRQGQRISSSRSMRSRRGLSWRDS